MKTSAMWFWFGGAIDGFWQTVEQSELVALLTAEKQAGRTVYGHIGSEPAGPPPSLIQHEAVLTLDTCGFPQLALDVLRARKLKPALRVAIVRCESHPRQEAGTDCARALRTLESAMTGEV